MCRPVNKPLADLVGSTALHEHVDAETPRRFMDGYYRAMRLRYPRASR